MSSAVQSPPSVQPLGETPQTVEFYVGMTNRAVKRCAPGEFEARALESSLFESIPDGAPVKVYFDADHKFTTDFELYDERAAGEVMRLHKLYVGNHLRQITGIEPKFAHAEASYKSRLIKGVEYWAYSFHLVVPNITMSKGDIKRMARDLNEFIVQDQKAAFTTITGADKYTDYIPEMTEAFDLAVYNSGVQKVRCVHASKEGETRPFKLVEGSFEDMVITAFVPADAVHHALAAPAAAPREPCAAPTSDVEREMNKKFVEMCLAAGMFCVAARDFKTWSDMGLFLKGYFGDNDGAYALFDEFSKLAGAGHYTPEDNRDKWDKLAANPDKYDNFGTFVNWAKKDNMGKYKEIAGEIATLKKNNRKAKPVAADPHSIAEIVELYMPESLRSDVGSVEFIVAHFPGKFVWIEGVLYSWTGAKWETGNSEFVRCLSGPAGDALRGILAKATEDLSGGGETQQQALKKLEGNAGDKIRLWRTRREHMEIIKTSEAFLTRNDLKFDANPDLIGFENGVYDLVAFEFRAARYDDYVTMSCGYDYNPDVDPAKTDAIHALLDTIMPNPENKRLLLEVMSNGLTGRAIEKFVMFNGGGRNGKGLLTEFLKTIFGDYQLIYANVSLLTEKTKTGANPELASIHNKRIVVMKEPDAGEKLNNGSVNAITGGGNVSGRMLFSNKTTVDLKLLLIMECNQRPTFKADPVDAEALRLVDILFPNKFTTDEEDIDGLTVFRANGDYKTDEWKLAHRDAFLQILIEAFRGFQARKYAFDIPQNVKDRTRAHLNASLPLLSIMGELYTKTGASTDVVKLADAYAGVKTTEEWRELHKDRKRLYNYKFFCEFIQANREYRGDYHERIKVGAVQYKTVLVGYVLTADMEEAE